MWAYLKKEDPARWKETILKGNLKRTIECNEFKKLIYDHYGEKCNCCGIVGEIFLCIDHVNNDGAIRKKLGEPKRGREFYLWIINNNFPEDLQILCYNCNSAKHKNNGKCPHQESKTQD